MYPSLQPYFGKVQAMAKVKLTKGSREEEFRLYDRDGELKLNMQVRLFVTRMFPDCCREGMETIGVPRDLHAPQYIMAIVPGLRPS